MGIDDCDECRRPYPVEAVDIAVQKVSEITGYVSTLAQVLEPVLKPEGPGATKADSSDIVQEILRSPLMHSFSSLHGILQSLLDSVQELTARVDL